MEITAVVLTKDSERHLPQCLASLEWVAEILVYDSGSSDSTLEIAERFGARVIVDEDWQGFGRQRQKAQEYVKTDWVLWLDSDEVLSEQARESIVSENLDPSKVYQFNRRSRFLGKFMRFGGWYPDRVARFYDPRRFQYDGCLVHEKIDCGSARIETIPGDVMHYTADDLDAFIAKNIRYSELWAKDKLSEKKSVSITAPFTHALSAFISTLVFKLAILDGWRGVLLSKLRADFAYHKYRVLYLSCKNSL